MQNENLLGQTLDTAAEAAKKLSTNATLWIQVASFIYQTITAAKPFKNKKNNPQRQDLRRYTDLCKLRQAVSPAKTFPEQWLLDSRNAPKKSINFDNLVSEIKRVADDVNESDYPQKNLVKRMVVGIAELFEGLDKRSDVMGVVRTVTMQGWKNYREDGIEAMFFSDLAMWLSIYLPRYDVRRYETVDIVDAWIEYCGQVQDHVLIYREDATGVINHVPKVTLQETIKQLKVLRDNIFKYCEAATFNEKINHINTDFLNISAGMFTFFYLLLEDSTSSLAVDVFLKHGPLAERGPGDAIYAKQERLATYTLGRWIHSTLTTAGITANDFQNCDNLRLAEIEGHLRADYNEIENLSETGLWSFARESREDAIAYLEKIAELHRLLLTHCHIRSSLLLCARVSNVYGQAWVYGEGEGRETIQLLLHILEASNINLLGKLREFWQDFYDTRYLGTTRLRGDTTSLCYTRLLTANETVDHIAASIQRISDQGHEINAKINAASDQTVIARDETLRLQGNLIAYARHTGLEVDASLLRAVSRAFAQGQRELGEESKDPERAYAPEESKEEIQPIQQTRGSGALIVPRRRQGMRETQLEELITPWVRLDFRHVYEERSLYFFNQARVLLNEKVIREETLIALKNTTLPEIKPERFRSTFQKVIYDRYLQQNHGYADVWDWYGYISDFFYNHYLFLELYQRVNAVVKLLHLVETTGVQPQEIEVLLIDMMLYHAINDHIKANARNKEPIEWQETPPVEFTRLENNQVEVKLGVFKLKYFREHIADSHILPMLRKQDALVEALTRDKETLTAELRQRDTEIAEKNTEIAEKNAGIEQRDAVIEDQGSEIAQLRKALEEQEARLAAQDKRLDDLLKNSASRHRFYRPSGVEGEPGEEKSSMNRAPS